MSSRVTIDSVPFLGVSGFMGGRVERENQVLVVLRIKEGKEGEVLNKLAKFVQGLKDPCPDSFRLVLSKNVALVSMPYSFYMKYRGQFIDYVGDHVEDIIELTLPELNLAMVDSNILSVAFRDIESAAGAILTSTILFRVGLVYGRELARNASTMKAVTPGEKIKLLLELLRALHLYRNYEITKLTVDKIEIAFELEGDSLYSHFVRGVITGIVSCVLEKTYMCNIKKTIGNIVLIELVRTQPT